MTHAGLQKWVEPQSIWGEWLVSWDEKGVALPVCVFRNLIAACARAAPEGHVFFLSIASYEFRSNATHCVLNAKNSTLTLASAP